MEIQLLKTDEEIIREYGRLFDEFDGNEEFFTALESLDDKICPEKRNFWGEILKGLRHSAKGYGIGYIRSYDRKEEYAQAYIILNDAIKQITDKDSLLFLFLEEQRIVALALSFKKPVEEIILLFDTVIDHFKNSKNPDIQIQVANVMLNKSFVLWKYAKNNNNEHKLFKESALVGDEVIERFRNSELVPIQRVVAVSLNNRAYDLEYESEEKMKESLDVRMEIINTYKDYDTIDVLIQVAKAMFGIAWKSHSKYIIEDAKLKEGLSTEEEEKDYKTDAINAYNDLIKKFKQFDNNSIKLWVVMAMDQKTKIYVREEEINKALFVCEEMENYKNSNDSTIQGFVEAALKTKEELLEKNKKNKLIEQENIRIDSLQKRVKTVMEFYPQNEHNLDKLIELIRERKVTPFIGAGLSKFAGYPLWKDFLQSIYDKHQQTLSVVSAASKEDFDKLPCSRQASMLKENLGAGIFEQALEEIFSEDKLKESDDVLPGQSIYLLPDLFNGLILTTNFDKLIERVYFKKKNIQIKALSLNDIKKMHDIRNDIWVYKMHGTIDELNTIIITQEQYDERYREGTEYREELNRQMRGKDILFLGCSLEEDSQIKPFYEIGRNYAICGCLKENLDIKKVALSQKRIRPILYPPVDNHVYLKTILEYIIEKVNNQNFSFKETTYIQQFFDNFPPQLPEIEAILEEANYKTFSKIKIQEDRLPFIAIATDEILVLGDILPDVVESGEIKTSVKKLDAIYSKMTALFDEVLDKSLKINMLKLIVTPRYMSVDNSIQDKLSESDIKLACLEEKRYNYILKCLPSKEPPGDEEKEDFEAYLRYIKTTINYFKRI